MKKLIVLAMIAMLSTSVYAAVKCQPDGRGGMCCWDTEKDGPWKPIGC
jgi:hypothetical protein